VSAEASLRVRSAYPRDARALEELNRRLAQETEGLELDAERLAAGIRALFDDPSRGTYFVAERDGRPVACLLVTQEWSDWRNGVFWWIGSVYVVPEERKRGTFRRLYDAVLERARATREVCGVRLYVDRENTGAQAVYDSVGMSRSRYRMYEVDFVLEEGARVASPRATRPTPEVPDPGRK
jgi:GNAT superfamily N-acetyltransferase